MEKERENALGTRVGPGSCTYGIMRELMVKERENAPGTRVDIGCRTLGIMRELTSPACANSFR